MGNESLLSNTTGSSNVASGRSALRSNTIGASNTAIGDDTLLFNTTGGFNTALGTSALYNNATASNNTAVGSNALLGNTTGSSNIALGASAGSALTTGRNNIDIGNVGNAGESGKIRIGTSGTQKATFIAGISGVTVPGGVGVLIGTDGKLGTVVSSARFKEEIQSMDKRSEAILYLRPVTFRYQKELDPDAIPQFGLVAEEVAQVDPDLVARDQSGQPYSVRYEAVNVMLLNEFLKERNKVRELEAALDAVNKRVEEQDAKIREVSAHVERSNPAAQLVSND